MLHSLSTNVNVRATYFSTAWVQLLRSLYIHGKRVSPRQQQVRELVGVHLHLEDARENILVHPVRNLNFRFMVAEWLWMWFGRDDVATISQYNKQLAQFSDNGINFNGAYGVPIKAQWAGLVDLLKRDRDTRQAVLQIYRVPHGPTKDVPCTINLQFLVRHDELHIVANMRSSDIWLGLPYDVFNFTMLGQCMAAEIGARVGSLDMHLGSSHLYERDADNAKRVLEASDELDMITSPPLTTTPPAWLEDVLVNPAQAQVSREVLDRPHGPWLTYALILGAPRDAAYTALKHASRLIPA